MPRGHVTWTPSRDAMILKCHAQDIDPDVIARQLGVACISPRAVAARLNQLGQSVRIRHRDAFWTRERDDLLRALWVRVPRLKIHEMRETLGANCSDQWISRRAMELLLTPRHASAGKMRTKRVRDDVEVTAARTSNYQRSVEELRSPIAGAKLHDAVTTPKPRRVIAPLETPCPFYHPMEMDGPCGVMVNRRPGALGIKPSQYCKVHEKRVLPLERGSLGMLATYGRERRFG